VFDLPSKWPLFISIYRLFSINFCTQEIFGLDCPTMVFRTFLLINLLALTLLSGCGFVNDKKTEELDQQVQNIGSSCEINEERITKLFSEKVTQDINCLEENLWQFIKYVKREDKSYIAKEELAAFVRKFFPKNARNLNSALDLFFEFNTLYQNDPSGKLSISNVPHLMSIVMELNIHAVEIKAITDNTNRENFWQQRELVFAKVQDFANVANKFCNVNDKAPGKIKFKEFIELLADRFDSMDLTDSQIQFILGLKKLFLGGESEIITATELQRVFQKLPFAAQAGFDMFFADKAPLDELTEKHQFYVRSIESIQAQFFRQSDSEVLINFQDLQEVFADTKFQNKTLSNLIEIIKRNMLSPGENLTFYDVRWISNLSMMGLELLTTKESHQKLLKILEVSINQWPKVEDDLTKLHQTTSNSLLFRMEKSEEIKYPWNISGLLHDVAALYEIKKLNPDIVEIILGLKKSLVGGQRDRLISSEMKILLTKYKQLAGQLAQIPLLKKEYLGKDYLVDQAMANILKEFTEQLQTEGAGEFFKTENVLGAIDEFVTTTSESKKFKKFLASAQMLKGKVLGGKVDQFSLSDLRKTLTLGIDFLQGQSFMKATYDNYQAELSSPLAIKDIALPKLKLYANYSADELLNYYQTFKRLALDYRFFRAKDSNQNYSDKYGRNRDGLVELSMIRFGLGLLIDKYGRLVNGSYQLNRDEVEKFLWDAKPLLEEFKMWTKVPKNYARNTVLMADLFQYQSNGDGELNLDEVTEYAGLVLGAVNVGDKLVKQLKIACPYTGTDVDPKFDILCVRPKIFNTIFDDLKLRSSFSRLDSYLSNLNEKDKLEYAESVEKFGRDYPDETIPVDSREINLIVGSFMSIESTMLRFDTNLNNRIDPIELERAFLVFRKGIIEIAELKPDEHKYAHSIFIYLVKYRTIPTKKNLAIFHYNPFNEKTMTAHRLNIGSVLYNIVMKDKPKIAPASR
jgi:hypothetical protein